MSTVPTATSNSPANTLNGSAPATYAPSKPSRKRRPTGEPRPTGPTAGPQSPSESSSITMPPAAARCAADPCPVWRRAERVNIGIARRVQDDYYPLHPAALDRKLADGVVSTTGDDDTLDDGF